jgi:hypothetical protein
MGTLETLFGWVLMEEKDNRCSWVVEVLNSV